MEAGLEAVELLDSGVFGVEDALNGFSDGREVCCRGRDRR